MAFRLFGCLRFAKDYFFVQKRLNLKPDYLNIEKRREEKRKEEKRVKELNKMN